MCHWDYLEHKYHDPQSVESWVPIQDPKYTEPQWYVPYLEGVGSVGAALSPFLAPVAPQAPYGPNIGFIWLRDLPGGPGSFDYLYTGHLWLVTLRPIPAGAFCRAHVKDAWSFYSWGPLATELARQYEQVFRPGTQRPILGGPVAGSLEYHVYNFSELEYTSGGVPRLHGYYSVPGRSSAPASPSSQAAAPASDSSTSVVLVESCSGPFDAGLLSRTEVFTDRGGLHPKAYDVSSNFLEDGRPLPFAELVTWRWIVFLRSGLPLGYLLFRARSVKPSRPGPSAIVSMGQRQLCSVRSRRSVPVVFPRRLFVGPMRPLRRLARGPVRVLGEGMLMGARTRCGVPVKGFGLSRGEPMGRGVCWMVGPPVCRTTVLKSATGTKSTLGLRVAAALARRLVRRSVGRASLTAYLAAVNGGDHVPSEEETVIFFNRVFEVMDTLSNDILITKHHLVSHLKRLFRNR